MAVKSVVMHQSHAGCCEYSLTSLLAAAANL